MDIGFMRFKLHLFLPIYLFMQLITANGCTGQGDSSLEAELGFAELTASLSEPGGYFDTDNLISNESSYLHVLPQLQSLNIQGGAYIGVGPDQNFSYIAALKPRIAFMVDIRPDNKLQHLLFKALFHYSKDRMSFLCLLLGRPYPEDGSDWKQRPIEDIITYLTMMPQNPENDTDRLIDYLQLLHLDLSEDHKKTIRRFHDIFIREGLNLKFNSHNRRALSEYPTLGELILEEDRNGKRANYLVSEESFQVVRALQEEDRIIPVVGDLSGQLALKNIADYLRRREIQVSAFYTSNVEYYLSNQNQMNGFIKNLEHLPIMDNAVIIRSYFNRWASHPLSMPGHPSTQMLHRVRRLIEGYNEGRLYSYSALLRDFEPIN